MGSMDASAPPSVVKPVQSRTLRRWLIAAMVIVLSLVCFVIARNVWHFEFFVWCLDTFRYNVEVVVAVCNVGVLP